MGIGNLLKKAAKTNGGAKKSKSTTPQIDRPDLEEAIKKWEEGKKMEKDGKAMRVQAEGVILPEAEEERLRISVTDGKHHSSVRVNGKVTISTQNKYSPIGTEHEETIRKVVGDKFEEFFKEKTNVSLKPSLLSDEEAMGKIVEAVGEENFMRFFEVKQSLTPTQAFHEQRSTSKEIYEMFESLNDQGIVNPYKAAVKK